MYRVTQPSVPEIPQKKGSLNRRIRAAGGTNFGNSVRESKLPTLTRLKAALFFCPDVAPETRPSRLHNPGERTLESPKPSAPRTAKG